MEQRRVSPQSQVEPAGSRTRHWQAPRSDLAAASTPLSADHLHALHAAAAFPATTNGTLLFLFADADSQVLLIDKLRGHGAGLVNGPGGKVDPGETRLSGALREMAEELHVQVLDARLLGELRFVSQHGPDVWGWVYQGRTWLGRPTATAEAAPDWCPVTAIPYHRMWPGDAHWLPSLLAGVPFRATLQFHDDAVVQALITEYSGGAR